MTNVPIHKLVDGKEELWCAAGKHYWTREPGQRGRKPRACEQHREAPSFVWKINDKCQQGVIVATDGREALVETPAGDLEVFKVAKLQPFVAQEVTKLQLAQEPNTTVQLDEVQTEIAVGLEPNEPQLQTLTCKRGHEWTRPVQKGPKPHYCPEHRAAPQTVGEGRTGAHTSPEELASIGQRVKDAAKAYDEAFAQATKAKTPDDINLLWNKADIAQNRYIGVLNRKRLLEATYA